MSLLREEERRVLPRLLAGVALVRLLMLAGLLITGAVSLDNDYYWEYGKHAKYLLDGKGYVYYHPDAEGRMSLWPSYDPDADPAPSAYMPPGYVFFLVPYLLIHSGPLRNLLLFGTQLAVSLAVALLLYRLTRKRFGPATATLATLLYAVSPDQAYLVFSFTPVLLFHVALMLSLLWLERESERPGDAASWGRAFRETLPLGTLIAVSIYLRSEAALLGILMLGLLLLERKPKRVFSAGIIVILLLAPWQIRNTVTFGRYVPLTTGGSLNLYRGHNPEAIASYNDPVTDSLRAQLTPGDDFEMRLSDLHMRRVRETIAADPWKAVTDGFVKAFHLWVVFPQDKRAANPPILAFWLAVLALSLYGLWRGVRWRRDKYILIFLLHSTLVAMVFFALPRYQTTMKIVLYPYAGLALLLLARWLLPEPWIRRLHMGPPTE